MGKKKRNKKRKSSQKSTSNVNNKKRYKNKWKSMLFEGLKWFIPIFLGVVICTCVEHGIPTLFKYSSFLPPSLDTSGSKISVNSIEYYANIPEDTTMNQYLVIQTGKTGITSINLTNNDESNLVVNDIYLEVFDYQPITDIVLSNGKQGGSYNNPVYYGVQLENSCKEYKCTLLDKEGAGFFLSHYELPNETNFKVMGEQIEYNQTDEIKIIFSPQYQGIYRFKIIIDYSIRNFNNRIESGEFDFISLDSNFMHQS